MAPFDLALSIFVCFLAAAAGSVATRRASDFYRALRRPRWSPPGWVFAPVWTLLYLLMALALWLVWRESATRDLRPALLLFGAQLFANALWSWLFFAWRKGALAFADALLLVALVAATTLAFWSLRPLAALLLLPYLGWVAFASLLSWNVWQHNRRLLG